MDNIAANLNGMSHAEYEYWMRDADKGVQTCKNCNGEAVVDDLCEYCERYCQCRRCGKVGDDVEERYSFGVYASVLCVACCSSYRDNCGVGQPEGNPADLDEPLDDY